MQPLDSHDKGWVEALVLIDAPAETIWHFMTDCEEAVAFVPELTGCEVLDSGKNWEIIRHDVKWIWFLPKISYVFRAEYQKNRHIDFERIDGDLRDVKGSWHLYPLNKGRQTAVSYGVYIDPGFFLPQWIVRQVVKMQLPNLLSALRMQAQTSKPIFEPDH